MGERRWMLIFWWFVDFNSTSSAWRTTTTGVRPHDNITKRNLQIPNASWWAWTYADEVTRNKVNNIHIKWFCEQLRWNQLPMFPICSFFSYFENSLGESDQLSPLKYDVRTEQLQKIQQHSITGKRFVTTRLVDQHPVSRRIILNAGWSSWHHHQHHKWKWNVIILTTECISISDLLNTSTHSPSISQLLHSTKLVCSMHETKRSNITVQTNRTKAAAEMMKKNQNENKCLSRHLWQTTSVVFVVGIGCCPLASSTTDKERIVANSSYFSSELVS